MRPKAEGGRAAARVVSAEARVRRATEAWFIIEPLLFGAWMTHRLVETQAIATLRSGDGRVEYNPAFIAGLPDRELAEVLRLEAVRIVLKHPYSRRPASGRVAYLASNITLREHVPTTLALPTAADVFGDPAMARQYYEFYCDRLLDRSAGAAGPGAGASPQGPGEGAAEEEGDGAGTEPAGGGGPPGAAAHFDASRGPESTHTWQEDTLAREMIDEVIRDAEAARAWGTLPGALVAQILATLKPQLDYRKVLRGFRTSILASKRELTRMKPSRRYGSLYMGSRHALRSRLLVAVDVSGSVSREELEKAFSVINRLFQYGIESIDCVQFDAELRGPPVTVRRRRPEVQVLGRGGTDFGPVLRYIDEHPDHDGLIIITDGMAPRPEPPKNRRTRVLWLFHHQDTYQSMRDNVAHIGRAAYIKPDAAHGSRSRRSRSP